MACPSTRIRSRLLRSPGLVRVPTRIPVAAAGPGAPPPPAPRGGEPLGEEGLVGLDPLPSHLGSTVHGTAPPAPSGLTELRSAVSTAFPVSSPGLRSARRGAGAVLVEGAAPVARRAR